jgi:hypothetical protein
MKVIFAILSLVSISSTVLAADCEKAVLELAKANLDSKAKAYSFESSDINESTLKKVRKDSKTGSALYIVAGSIYRANYIIHVGVDSSCGIETLKIQ